MFNILHEIVQKIKIINFFTKVHYQLQLILNLYKRIYFLILKFIDLSSE